MFFSSHWRRADWKQPLDADQVHVWAWSIHPACSHFDQGDLRLLDDAERQRYFRFHFEADRTRFAIAHVVVRRILGAYLGCEPGQVTLRASRSGKPIVASPKPLFINLSHSRTAAILALSKETEVGVDIEDVRPVEPDVARHYFSPAEQAALASLEGDGWLDGFYRCWTRKEAILKAEGMGLQWPLSSFDVSLDPAAPAAWLAVRRPSVFSLPWTLHHLETGAGTVAALAAGNPDAQVACFQPHGL